MERPRPWWGSAAAASSGSRHESVPYRGLSGLLADDRPATEVPPLFTDPQAGTELAPPALGPAESSPDSRY